MPRRSREEIASTSSEGMVNFHGKRKRTNSSKVTVTQNNMCDEQNLHEIKGIELRSTKIVGKSKMIEKGSVVKKSSAKKRTIDSQTNNNATRSIQVDNEIQFKRVKKPSSTNYPKLQELDFTRYPRINDSVFAADGVDVNVDPALDDLDYHDNIHPDEYGSDDESMAETVPEPDDTRDDGREDERDELHLGATATATATEDDILKQNPQLKKLFNQFLDERLKQAEKDGIKGGAAEVIKGLKEPKTSKKSADEVNFSNKPRNKSTVVKSPSDTTIYVPALARPNDGIIGSSPVLANMLMPKNAMMMNNMPMAMGAMTINDQVDDFVGRIREEATASTSQANDGMGHNRKQSEVVIPGYDDARRRADQAILQAEKFKATITPPKTGNLLGKVLNEQEQLIPVYINNKGEIVGQIEQEQLSPIIDNEMNGQVLQQQVTPPLGTGLSDDDFFHLTCHIDTSLHTKIEKGEFVDLDRLIPKDRFSQFDKNTETGNPLQWIQNESGTFLVPSKRTSRINSFRRWEQAFRVYATIYCGANPNRSREVWQYISVINTAAKTFIWDNVYNYDITFRQLMQFNPARDWAVTYNQMWNLTMKEHIVKTGPSKGASNHFHAGSGGNNTPQRSFKRNRSDYCWNFNRGLPCKYDRNCKYIERCKYCDAGDHGINICPKLESKGTNYMSPPTNGQQQVSHSVAMKKPGTVGTASTSAANTKINVQSK